MIFSEIYGSYFNAAAKIIDRAVSGELREGDIEDIVLDEAFGESVINLPSRIRSGEWGLLTPDLRTPVKHKPKMPLTLLQKRWLKAIMSDPRIRLFGIECRGLDGIKPLYDRDTFVYFDRYNDGDPYEDEKYIRNFREALRAVKEKRRLNVSFISHRGHPHEMKVEPYRLEYSPQDDKFRLLALRKGVVWTINIARIKKCRVQETAGEAVDFPKYSEEIVLELNDERSALERAMLHFSHLEKKTERIGDDRYRITLRYDKDDETEMLIRIIAFGPVIRVVEPLSFIELIRKRLKMQKALIF